MQSIDHYILGRYIIENCNIHTDRLSEKMFMAGCIEPDLNPLTYMRGSIKYHFLHGHNADNSRRHLMHVMEKLGDKGLKSPVQWFVFGTAIHYIADSFTFAHNEMFGGNIAEHVRYEKFLHPVFADYLKSCKTESGLPSARIFRTVSAYHDKYLADKRSYLTDCRYIVRASCEFACAVISCYIEKHEYEMAYAAAHHKKMEDFVQAE